MSREMLGKKKKKIQTEADMVLNGTSSKSVLHCCCKSSFCGNTTSSISEVF